MLIKAKYLSKMGRKQALISCTRALPHGRHLVPHLILTSAF